MLSQSATVIFITNFMIASAEKVTQAQLFSCEYFEIFTSTYFEKHLRTTDFEI